MSNIAIVNISKVLDKARRATMFARELQSVAQDWQRKMQAAESLREQIETKLSKVAEGATVDNVFGLERERRLAEMDMNNLKERSELDLNLRAQRFQAQVADEIAPIIAEYSKNKGIDVILNAPGSHILFAKPELDITDEIIRLYDEKSSK